MVAKEAEGAAENCFCVFEARGDPSMLVGREDEFERQRQTDRQLLKIQKREGA